MSRRRTVVFWVLLLVFSVSSSTALAQLGGPRELRKIKAKPDEMISMSSSLPFNEAVSMFSDLSKKHLGKIIIDPENRTTPIGVNVENMHWLDAFELVLKANNLWYQEFPDHIMIKPMEEGKISEEAVSARELYQTREVVISAVFFEANLNRVRSLGMGWKFWNTDSTQVASMSAADSKSSLLTLSIGDKTDFGNMTALFRALENNQAGEILASPQIVVRSEKEGRIQIGSDFSVTTQDFAGNTVTQFFSTGSIITVTPDIYQVDTTNFIHLQLDVQKSSAGSSDLGIEVKKSSAQTSILLLDGEETMIGGLYTNEESTSREGIPFLKDLPWWFFGLRYVFGYESRSTIRKELVILLKAELVPTLDERIKRRMAEKRPPRVLEKSLEYYDKKIEKYQDQSKASKKK